MIVTPIDAVTADSISSRYYHLIEIMFAVGYLMHVLYQVNAAATAKNNPINSRLTILRNSSIQIVVRFFMNVLLFGLIWHYPSVIASGLGDVGVNLSPNMTAILTLPMNPLIAGGWGYCIDSLLAFIPLLKNAVPPPINGSAVIIPEANVVINVPKAP
jgi:hypothetical protein